MKLHRLKKLYASDPTLIVQIISNSYSGYCIRVKQGNDYHTLEGWFGQVKTFDSIEKAKRYLQLHTPIRYAYLVQNIAQDEVDRLKANEHDLHTEAEELGAKIELFHE